MSKINYLVPGYTQQQFSSFRSLLYSKVEHYDRAKVSLEAIACIAPIVIISKASEFIEIPIKLIEDMALTLINLVGSLFCIECRGHLKECAWQISVDLGYFSYIALIAGLVAITVLSPPTAGTALVMAGSIFTSTVILGGHCLIEGLNVRNMANYHRIFYYRTEAIRQCGYRKVEKAEKHKLRFSARLEIKNKSPFDSFFERAFNYFYKRMKEPLIAVRVYKKLLENTENARRRNQDSKQVLFA